MIFGLEFWKFIFPSWEVIPILIFLFMFSLGGSIIFNDQTSRAKLFNTLRILILISILEIWRFTIFAFADMEWSLRPTMPVIIIGVLNITADWVSLLLSKSFIAYGGLSGMWWRFVIKILYNLHKFAKLQEERSLNATEKIMREFVQRESKKPRTENKHEEIKPAKASANVK